MRRSSRRHTVAVRVGNACVVARQLRFEPPREPPRREWFVAGTAVAVVCVAAAGSLTQIACTGDGTVIALDPDIPPSPQRVFFRSTGGGRWQLGATAFAGCGWLPHPGRHRLALFDSAGSVVDAFAFEVRSLRGAAAARSRR